VQPWLIEWMERKCWELLLPSLATSLLGTINMTDQPTFANCSLLIARKDFASYVQELNLTTGFNVTLLEACKGDICNALWGDGNADISGIGVSLPIVGYNSH